MQKYKSLSYLTIFSLTLLAGCSESDNIEANHSEMDHSHMEHSEMDHSEMAQPVPDTKDQAEVKQQSFDQYISSLHEKGIKGKNIKVAVLDTGIDTDNKDLKYVKGINFVSNDAQSFEDDNGHGTKISGIIGARENKYNLLGIAPDVYFYIAKVADENGNVQVENLIKGIDWAIKEKVDLINISLELAEYNETLHKAIKKANEQNIIVIASSGNIKYENDTELSYPGAYPEVINIGMLNSSGNIYSDEFKKKNVDVFAPGEDLFSLYLDDKMTLDTGVSFSTAFSTGYAALLIQQYKDAKMNYDTEKIKADMQKNLYSNK